jgi:hypothetical protein
MIPFEITTSSGDRMRYLLAGMILMVLGGCDFIGGADTLVRGSNNIIARDADSDVVAKALAEFEVVPAVTDEELVTIYQTIREAALDGDLKAIQVMLRLAAIQRAPVEEEVEE